MEWSAAVVSAKVGVQHESEGCQEAANRANRPEINLWAEQVYVGSLGRQEAMTGLGHRK